MKLLLKLVVGLVLLFALLVVGVGFLIDPAALKAVAEGVTSATGCTSTLGSAHIGLLSGDVAFEDLEIANPPGFSEKPLLALGDFNASWDTRSLFSEEVQVNQLELDGLVLAMELQGAKTNLGPLMDRLRELSSAGEGGPAPEGEPAGEGPAPEGEGGKKLHIDKIRVAGVRAELNVSGVPGVEGQYAVDVPEFMIEDLGNGEKSATLSEWSARILEVVLDEARKAGDGKFPAQWQGLLSGDLEALKGEALEQLEGQAEDWLEKNKDELPGDVKKGLEALEKEGGLGGLLGND